MRRSLGCALIVFAAVAANAQEAGRLIVRSVEIESQTVTAPINDIVQGPDGVIYVASGRGVGVFDGVRWGRARVGTSTRSATLAVDARGRVWAGGDGDVGWIGSDSTGHRAFVSLLPHLPEAMRPTGYVRSVHAVGETVYVATERQLVRWSETAPPRRWRSESAMTVSIADETVYVHDGDRGLLRLRGDRLEPVPGADAFRRPGPVSVVQGPESADLLAITERGIWQVVGSRFTRRPTEADAILARFPARVEDAAWADGLLALTTEGGGLVLLRPDGRLHARLTAETGLPDATPRAVRLDQEGGIWVGSEEGLVRIGAPQAIRQFAEAEGLRGVILDVDQVGERRVVATSNGLFLEREAGRFVLAPLTAGVCSALVARGGVIVAACARGLFETDGRATQRVSAFAASALA
ncbi:MAG: hypothetical protein AAGK21_16980, partial [Bacteroidota bacterium]